MSDLKKILEKALTDVPVLDATVDPSADLARGRNRLQRRRTALLGGVTAVVLVAGLTPVALSSLGTGPSPRPSATSAPALNSVALVSYTGRQPQGYTVDSVPEGWEIQGGDSAALTIAPKGAADQDPSTFVGKLVVLSASEGEQNTGTPQPVDGRPGTLAVQDDVQILQYTAATGRSVVIQAPTSLGWDGDRIARFAAGVTVLKGAQDGHG